MLLRVVLDTCVVRSALHERRKCPLANLPDHEECIRFSLADSAFLELAAALVNESGGLSWSAWQDFDELMPDLDPRWPTLPGGRQLVATILEHNTFDQQLIDDAGVSDVNIEDERLLLCAQWQHLRHTKNTQEFERQTTYTDTLGNPIQFQCDASKVEEFCNSEVTKRASFFELLATLEMPQSGDRNSHLPSHSPLSTLVPEYLQLLRWVANQSGKKKSPYNPRSPRNKGDVHDESLLFYLPLPAIICTTDERFISRVRHACGENVRQILSVEEFLELLKQGRLREVVAARKTPEAQLRRWKESAYLNWISRDRPPFDADTDWHAVEPVA